MTEFTPANANPWYVLMTLYGEQTGKEVDQELHEKNRAIWNAWAVHASITKAQESLSVIPTLPSPDEWHGRGAEIRSLFEKVYEHRNPDVSTPSFPEPMQTNSIDMRDLLFLNQLCISQFFIPKITRFSGSKFKGGLVAQSAVFDGLASFTECWFSAIVTFSNSKFHDALDFKGSIFEAGLDLQGSKCVDLIVNDCRFKGDLMIVDVACSGLAAMSSIKPHDAAKWSISGFQFSTKGAIYFNDNTVYGDVDFRQADFGGGDDGFQYGCFREY